MSDMQRNRGIIKRISTKESAREVFDKLVTDGIIDPKWCEIDEKSVHYIDHDDYEVVDGAIFDVSGAPDERDPSEQGANEAVKLNDTDYRVHAYFYNGGASFGEMLDESIPKADKEYEDRSKGTFWAVKLKNGNYMTRNTSAAPALYTTRNRAISTIEKNWPGIVDIGYELVKFGEI